MEIYDRDMIYYIMPLSQQSQFLSLFSSSESISSDDSSGAETEIDEVTEESASSHSMSSFEELWSKGWQKSKREL